MLLYGHCEVHTWMDRAVVVECASGCKRPKRGAVITIEILIIAGRAILFRFIRLAILPGAIFNGMRNGHIINKAERLTLANGDGVCLKVRVAHMD